MLLFRLSHRFNLTHTRFIYQDAEPSSSSDASVLAEAVNAAAEKTNTQLEEENKNKPAIPEPARTTAIDAGKESAKKAVEATSTPDLPPISERIKGLKIGEQAKKSVNGNVEREFTFGDLDIPGRIIMPDTPNPNKKTTIVFNYVEDTTKSADSEKQLLETLKKSTTDLGNTVIVTLRTPEGTTMIDKEKVDTMTALMSDLEKFQDDLNKDPKRTNITLARAETVLHMTSAGKQKNVRHLLEQYKKSSASTDKRVAAIAGVVDTAPDKIEGSLEALLEIMNAPEPTEPEAADTAPANDTDTTGGPLGGGGSGGSGGGGGGGAIGGETGSGGGSSASESVSSDSSENAETATNDTPTETATSDAETSTESPTETTPEANDLASEGIDKVLILGDSKMELTQNRVRKYYGFEHVEATAVRSKHLSQLHGELKARKNQLDKLNTDKCRGTILVQGGGNDIAAGKTVDQIFGYMEAMMKIAAEKGLKIFFCALTPFGDTTYNSLKTNYEEKNAVRTGVNEKLYALAAANPNTLGVIPLDKKYSEGGLADDEDPNKLHEKVRAGDGLHFSGNGTDRMAEIIQKHLGELKQASKEAPDSTTLVTPTSQVPQSPSEGQEWVYEDHRKVGDLAAEYQRLWIRQGRPVGYKEIIEYNGQTYLLTVQAHSLKGATGRRIPLEKFQQAKRQNFPLGQVGTHWLYAVEVKKPKV